MKEIRLHGRGGQGIVLGAEMLASALVVEGKYAMSLPMFGFERRGAPVTASVRFDDKIIRERTMIYSPDCVVVLDPLLKDSPTIFSGLRPDGILVLNTGEEIESAPCPNARIAGIIDATGIALEEIGRPITNTCMLGAIAATTGWLSLNTVLLSLERYLKGEILKRSAKSAERGFREVIVKRW